MCSAPSGVESRGGGAERETPGGGLGFSIRVAGQPRRRRLARRATDLAVAELAPAVFGRRALRWAKVLQLVRWRCRMGNASASVALWATVLPNWRESVCSGLGQCRRDEREFSGAIRRESLCARHSSGVAVRSNG